MPRDTNDLLHGTLDLLVLKAISWQPTHGYGISRRIEQRTHDELQIVDSALYKCPPPPEGRGPIAPAWGAPANHPPAPTYQPPPLNPHTSGPAAAAGPPARTAKTGSR